MQAVRETKVDVEPTPVLPCPACGDLWARFYLSGTTGSVLFHATCLRELCGPRTDPVAETLVRRKAPKPIAPGTKGWWEKP
jgi:hypothetical protein